MTSRLHLPVFTVANERRRINEPFFNSWKSPVKPTSHRTAQTTSTYTRQHLGAKEAIGEVSFYLFRPNPQRVPENQDGLLHTDFTRNFLYRTRLIRAQSTKKSTADSSTWKTRFSAACPLFTSAMVKFTPCMAKLRLKQNPTKDSSSDADIKPSFTSRPPANITATILETCLIEPMKAQIPCNGPIRRRAKNRRK